MKRRSARQAGSPPAARRGTRPGSVSPAVTGRPFAAGRAPYLRNPGQRTVLSRSTVAVIRRSREASPAIPASSARRRRAHRRHPSMSSFGAGRLPAVGACRSSLRRMPRFLLARPCRRLDGTRRRRLGHRPCFFRARSRISSRPGVAPGVSSWRERTLRRSIDRVRHAASSSAQCHWNSPASGETGSSRATLRQRPSARSVLRSLQRIAARRRDDQDFLGARLAAGCNCESSEWQPRGRGTPARPSIRRVHSTGRRNGAPPVRRLGRGSSFASPIYLSAPPNTARRAGRRVRSLRLPTPRSPSSAIPRSQETCPVASPPASGFARLFPMRYLKRFGFHARNGGKTLPRAEQSFKIFHRLLKIRMSEHICDSCNYQG